MSSKQPYFTRVTVSNMRNLLKKQKKPSSGSKVVLFNRLSTENVKKLAEAPKASTLASVKTKPKSTRKGPEISATNKSLKIGNVTKGLNGNMWTLVTTSSGVRRWSKSKIPPKTTLTAYKKISDNMESNTFKMNFAAGRTDTWGGLKVPKKVLTERNKYIKKLKNLDNEALKKMGSNLFWNPRLNWAVQEGAPRENTPNGVVTSMKQVYNMSAQNLKNDINYLKMHKSTQTKL